MLDLLFGLGAQFWPYIAGAAALLMTFLGARQSGKKSERAKQKERDNDRADEIRDRVRNDVDDILRKYDDAGYRD